jgi:hypothetical protein
MDTIFKVKFDNTVQAEEFYRAVQDTDDIEKLLHNLKAKAPL